MKVLPNCTICTQVTADTSELVHCHVTFVPAKHSHKTMEKAEQQIYMTVTTQAAFSLLPNNQLSCDLNKKQEDAAGELTTFRSSSQHAAASMARNLISTEYDKRRETSKLLVHH